MVTSFTDTTGSAAEAVAVGVAAAVAGAAEAAEAAGTVETGAAAAAGAEAAGAMSSTIKERNYMAIKQDEGKNKQNKN